MLGLTRKHIDKMGPRYQREEQYWHCVGSNWSIHTQESYNKLLIICGFNFALAAKQVNLHRNALTHTLSWTTLLIRPWQKVCMTTELLCRDINAALTHTNTNTQTYTHILIILINILRPEKRLKRLYMMNTVCILENAMRKYNNLRINPDAGSSGGDVVCDETNCSLLKVDI